MLLILCCVLFMNSKFSLVTAMSDEQKAMIHKHFEELGKECLKDYVITVDDIKKLRAKQIPEGENAPCLLACMLKKLGIMDDAGMLKKETALEVAKKVFTEEEELKLIEEYLHSCSHINSAEVTDGSKGCDRAIMAYKCMNENASKFGFDI